MEMTLCRKRRREATFQDQKLLLVTKVKFLSEERVILKNQGVKFGQVRLKLRPGSIRSSDKFTKSARGFEENLRKSRTLWKAGKSISSKKD